MPGNDLDPIAFFEHLAATSQSSNEDETRMTYLTVEKQQNRNMKQLLNSRSLETIKADNNEEDEDDDEENHAKEMDEADSPSPQQHSKSFSSSWHELVASYRLEKEALSQHLKDQLIALEEVEEHFDQANIDLNSKIENSYRELSMHIKDHQQHITSKNQQFQKEQNIMREIKRFQDEKIKLNVGGQLFETSLTTLRKDPNSMLASMFSDNSTIQPDADNSYFIDRDGTYFRFVLNYLRDLRIPAGVTQDPKIMDELMQEARFYGLNDLLGLRWKSMPVITQDELHRLYPLPIRNPNENVAYRPTVFQLQGKNLCNLDFSDYHIDPRSCFKDSYLENCIFKNSKFGFDFDYQVDFTFTYLKGATFPKEGTNNRASGVEIRMEGAILSENPEDMFPQNEHIEEHIKRHGRRLDYEERKRKREARQAHKASQYAQKVHGLKAKMLNKKRHAEKIQMKKTIKQHEEKNAKQKSADAIPEGAVPTYLLDREGEDRAKILSNMVKQKRKEKAGKWSVPLPTVRGMAEDEMFKVVKTGKHKTKQWKRLVTKATFVGEGFTRKPPKYERFVRPMGLRYKKAHVTHPELKATFCLPIIGVKKNPQSPLYTQLGVITKGTVLEVNVSELGLVTTGGKVVWGKYAQVTNNPEGLDSGLNDTKFKSTNEFCGF
ncbi:hypothetical protein [Parasitella parasitica]|uniref:Ribosome biogenesis protein NSA2 homolog n=1 Tax=Parasitella parasitica TaxID=35722 RepID=A0A0B7N167_9FUNG|nr:hypothetical protein [Parasitella parasitica]